MSSLDGKQKTGVTFTFEAWSEGLGSFLFWSTYTFNTLKEAISERDRLEKAWSKRHWKKSCGERKGGPYAGFEIYRVKTTHVPRSKKRGAT